MPVPGTGVGGKGKGEGDNWAARICDNVQGDHAVMGAFFVTGTTSAGHPSRRWKIIVPQPGRRDVLHMFAL
jgi:hypothetical protein